MLCKWDFDARSTACLPPRSARTQLGEEGHNCNTQLCVRRGGSDAAPRPARICTPCARMHAKGILMRPPLTLLIIHSLLPASLLFSLHRSPSLHPSCHPCDLMARSSQPTGADEQCVGAGVSLQDVPHHVDADNASAAAHARQRVSLQATDTPQTRRWQWPTTHMCWACKMERVGSSCLAARLVPGWTRHYSQHAGAQPAAGTRPHDPAAAGAALGCPVRVPAEMHEVHC